MKVQVVIGANYGDEGKGMVSGCLAREGRALGDKTLTVFYNGTSQRAHTFEGVVNRCLAAGTGYGSDTFYHKQFVVDPISLLITQATPIIDGECRVILPCDVIKNRKLEKDRGAARHGTCGFGLFEAVKRSKNQKYDLRIKELLDPWTLYQKLKGIEAQYGAFDDALYNTHYFMIAANHIATKCKIQSFDEVAGLYDRIIFEGGQGLMLDQRNMDCYPHLTPSCPGSFFISEDINKITSSPELFYVSRSYATRHGAGPMEMECTKEEINPDIVDSTNIENEYQGALRFGKLDLNNLLKRVENDTEFYRNPEVNMVFTQLNYTNHKLETVKGKMSILHPSFVDNIYLSDQKDYIEKWSVT